MRPCLLSYPLLAPLTVLLLSTSMAAAKPGQPPQASGKSGLPPRVIPYVRRGDALMGEEEFDKAAATYSQALQLEPRLTALYAMRADAYELGHKTDKALSDWNSIIALKPKMGSNYLLRGRVLENMGKDDLALKDYNHAIALGYKVGYKDSARLYERHGQLKECVEHISRYLETQKPLDSIQFYFDRARVYQKLGRADLAAADTSTATKLLKDCGTENIDKYPVLVPDKK
ncbi:MAG: hypothetical protein JSS86_16445 [Cyanobacteria bacterium SZAS LIN-2]|nr:hypothetical protein [Cyanobacteria bacterium SZAS LIN-2]